MIIIKDKRNILHFLCVLIFLFSFHLNSFAQTFKKENALLKLFTITDSIKYFEFYTPLMLHTDMQCGILKKVGSNNIYKLQYTSGPFFSMFSVSLNKDSVCVFDIQKKGWIATSLKGTFMKTSDSTKQNVCHFHLNNPTYFESVKKSTIKSYEFPSFEAKTKSICLNKGDTIQEKWHVGFYNKFSLINNKVWIAAMQGNTFIGWLLLSDVNEAFKKED